MDALEILEQLEEAAPRFNELLVVGRDGRHGGTGGSVHASRAARESGAAELATFLMERGELLTVPTQNPRCACLSWDRLADSAHILTAQTVDFHGLYPRRKHVIMPVLADNGADTVDAV